MKGLSVSDYEAKLREKYRDSAPERDPLMDDLVGVHEELQQADRLIRELNEEMEQARSHRRSMYATRTAYFVALREKGVMPNEIAKELGIHRTTVSHLIYLDNKKNGR